MRFVTDAVYKDLRDADAMATELDNYIQELIRPEKSKAMKRLGAHAHQLACLLHDAVDEIRFPEEEANREGNAEGS